MRRWAALPLLGAAFAMRLHGFTARGLLAEEGVLVTLGEQLLMGRPLYTGLLWSQPPGVPWLAAATFAIWDEPAVLRLLSAGLGALTCAALLTAGRLATRGDSPIGRGLAAFLPAALYAFAPPAIFWARFSLPENFQTAAAALAVAAALMGLRVDRPGWWWPAAGLLAGLAFVFHLAGIAVVVALTLFALGRWLYGLRPEARADLGRLAAGLGVALAVPAALVLPRGSFDDLIRQAAAAPDWLVPAAWPERLLLLGNWMTRYPLLPLALLGTWFASSSPRPAVRLIALWALIEGVALFLAPGLDFGFRGSGHRALPFLAAGGLLAGVGLAWGWDYALRAPAMRGGLAAIVTLFIWVALPGALADWRTAVLDDSLPAAGVGEEWLAGRVIAAGAPEGEGVLVVGNPGLYFWAGRPPAGRYFHLPAWLPGSDLAAEANNALAAALGTGQAAAVAVDAAYLDRLPAGAEAALVAGYWPVGPLPTAGEGALTLWMPREMDVDGPPAAVFEAGPALARVETFLLEPRVALVQLAWRVPVGVGEGMAVVVELVSPGGVRLAVDERPLIPADGSPVFIRPGELLTDWRLLFLSRPAEPDVDRVRVSLGGETVEMPLE